jgi:sulfur-oxidizing protein SoxB
VDQELDTFVGPNATCHTFGINAFPFGKGHTLCDPLDTVVGHTDPTIERFNVLEDISNNAMVDGFVDLARFVEPGLNASNSLSTTNGFRFDVTILGSDDGFSGNITVGDLYTYYPIGPGLALAEFSGGRIMDHWEGILTNVFDPNPFRQRGGWFLGYTANMHFDVELNEDFPISISDGRRIRSATIDGVKVDRSKTYTLASCYPHGNPVDEVCRTSGATNVRFIVGDQENCANPDLHGNCQIDVSTSAGYTVEPPENDADIWDPVRFAGGGPLFLRVAPFNFVHPVDALRRYLPNNDITTAAHGLGRVNGICVSEFGCTPEGAPLSEHGGPGIVQATQGAGPSWEKRIIAP